MRSWIILVFILTEGQSTLTDRRVLQLCLGCHEPNWSLLLRNIVLGHKLLGVDHGKKTVQCLDFNFLRIPNGILILQVRLRAQLSHITCRLPVQIALLERMEHFFLRMIERAAILLLIVGRDAVHQGLKGEPIFSLQLKLAFPLEFIPRFMTFALFLRQTLRLKFHETVNRLVITSRRLPL